MPQRLFMEKLRQVGGVLLFSTPAACGGSTSNETNGGYVIRVFNDFANVTANITSGRANRLRVSLHSKSSRQRCAGSVTVNVEPASVALST